MTSSEQSTSKRPPTTTGRRLGFTLDTRGQDPISPFVESCSQIMLDCFLLYYLLNIDLNVLLQIVAVQVEDQIVDKVESVTDDDQWQLVGEFSFLIVTHDRKPH